MFRSFLRRGVILLWMVSLCLLPLAPAEAAAPVRGEHGAERSWGAGWIEAAYELVAALWGKSTVEVDPPMGSGDGTGIDPHGVPRPRQNQNQGQPPGQGPR